MEGSATMTLLIATLEARPERRQHVRQALEEMVAEASTEDPELRRYEVYEDPARPNVFVMQLDTPVVEERLHEFVEERWLELGTGLRDELEAPVEVLHLRLLRALHPD
jgi:hypothetical protein